MYWLAASPHLYCRSWTPTGSAHDIFQHWQLTSCGCTSLDAGKELSDNVVAALWFEMTARKCCSLIPGKFRLNCPVDRDYFVTASWKFLQSIMAIFCKNYLQKKPTHATVHKAAKSHTVCNTTTRLTAPHLRWPGWVGTRKTFTHTLSLWPLYNIFN